MAEKNNAYCAICGNPYHVCMSCLDSMRLSPWKIHTDTSEHFKIYQVIHGFTSGVYSMDEAKIKLNNIDLRDIESFKPNIKEIIKDILKEEIDVSINEAERVVADIVEVEDNAVTENIENVVKSTASRKRNYKVEAE